MSGYSFSFDVSYCPKDLIFHGACFLVYYPFRDGYRGYAQFVRETSEDKLSALLPTYVWMQSENDLKQYSLFCSQPDAVILGQPRPTFGGLSKKLPRLSSITTTIKQKTQAFIAINIKQDVQEFVQQTLDPSNFA